MALFLRPGVLNAKDLALQPITVVRSKGAALRQGLPLVIAIVGAVGLEASISAFAPNVPFEWGVIIALVGGVACVMAQNTQLGFGFLRAMLSGKSFRSMILVIVSVFVFKDVMQQAGVVEEMSRVAGGGAALFASAAFLPFLVGMVAGINVAFVGATFPLLLGVLNSLGMQDQVVPYLILASFAGFTGVMVSPIHICFILTCQFFECDMARTWRKLVGPCTLLFFFGAGLFWYLR